MQEQQLDDFWRWYEGRVLRTRGKRPSENTLSKKKSRLRVVITCAGLPDLESVCTLLSDRAGVECLLDRLAARMTMGSMRHCVDVMRDLVPYAVAQGWIESSALRPEDTPPRNPQKPITVYTVDEMDALLASAPVISLRWWAFLATLIETGRRVGEVLGLEWEWLRLDADIPHFNLPHTKNGKQQYVPLSKFLREEVFTPENIERLKTERGRIAKGDILVRPFPWRYTTVDKMLARHCEKIAVPDRGFHNFRHTKATELLGRGVPIQAVSSLLGHASVQTTDRIYNHATALSFAHYVDA